MGESPSTLMISFAAPAGAGTAGFSRPPSVFFWVKKSYSLLAAVVSISAFLGWRRRPVASVTCGGGRMSLFGSRGSPTRAAVAYAPYLKCSATAYINMGLQPLR